MILVGSYAYLKNFRKGLRYQRERCLHAATDAGDAATAADCGDRLRWIREKQVFLDTRNEMVWDRPARQNDRQMDFGSLPPTFARVQENLLFVDPVQTDPFPGSCCSVASIFCRCQFFQAPLPLIVQAPAEVLQVMVRSDLKTSQIWGSCGTMLCTPSHAALDLNSNRPC